MPSNEKGVERFAHEHPNYVFTEFIVPEASLAEVWPLIHTLRVLVARPKGSDPEIVGTYLRFGNKRSDDGSGKNYVVYTTTDIPNFMCFVDFETGEYGDGRLVYADRIERCAAHPDSNDVAEGRIACWDEIVNIVLGVTERLAPLGYLGFDIGITPDGPKVMEINSHSGIHNLQVFRPLMEEPAFKALYEQKKMEAESADPVARRKIPR